MTSDDVLTGDVTVTVYDESDNPIKNARVRLYKNTVGLYDGFTSRLGECLIEGVSYDTYTLKVTHTGYMDSTDTLTVDDETVTEEITLTHNPLDPDIVEVDLDERYTFTVTERTIPDYTMSTSISQWLQTNLEALTDDNEQTIFGKVNTGFNEQALKTFGKNPVCDVYINRVEYGGNFDYHIPVKVHTIVLFYLKGANNHTYAKACELHDYIMQEFIENEGWRRLPNIVKDTYIMDSELRIQPLNKKWGVIGAFQLTHTLY